MSLLRSLAEVTLEKHPQRAATILERLDEDDTARLLGRGTLASTVAIVRRLSPHLATTVVSRLKAERARQVLEALPIETTARMMRRITPSDQQALFDSLDPKRARGLRLMLGFKPGSAGALMDPDVLAIPQEFSAREALVRIRKSGERTSDAIYVVDQTQRLVGVVYLRELLLARGRKLVSEIMSGDPQRVVATTSSALLLVHPGWQEVPALPVVDDQDAYLGVVHYRTLRALERELRAPQNRDSDTGAAFGQVIAAAAGGVIEAIGGGGQKLRGDQ